MMAPGLHQTLHNRMPDWRCTFSESASSSVEPGYVFCPRDCGHFLPPASGMEASQPLYLTGSRLAASVGAQCASSSH